MPELPEVETTVRGLRQQVTGRVIVDVHNDWPNHIAVPGFEELRKRSIGSKIESVSRRGKYLIFGLSSGDFLVVHLKMTGVLSYVDGSDALDPYAHTVFLFENEHQLRFRDVRKFGRVYLVKNLDDVVGDLGIEPLEEAFTPDLLFTMMSARKRIIKPLLLDQTFIAGIGNIYADEALHMAEIHPIRRSDSLSGSETDNLFSGIQKVLNLAIDRNGSSIDSYRKPDGNKGDMQEQLQVYGRQGQPCPRCGTVIVRSVIGGRGTHFCPGCQR